MPSGPRSDRPLDELPTGERVGRFRIVDVLGRGGMGVVYRAEDEHLRRTVALKLLPQSEVLDEPVVRRFLREARAAAAVTHPNVATIYDAGHEAARAYIAMEYVEGQSLRKLAGGSAMPHKDAVRIVGDIVRGVASAHARGIVHRDLKPDNVMIDASGHVKILDFGIAKLGSGDRPDQAITASHETAAGTLLGTPAYMSPEQARGERVDHRSDLFSIGVMLYELLTARQPFMRETALATVVAVAHESAPAPSTIVPGIPPVLDAIVERCMAKDPDQRPPTADALLRELLRSSGESLPPMVMPASSGHRWLLVAGTALTAIAAIAVAFWVWPEPSPPLSAATASESVPAADDPGPWRFTERRVTFVPAERVFLDARLSNDGRYVAYSDREGIYVRDVDTGEERPYPLPDRAAAYDLRWFSDGSRLLVAEQTGPAASLWTMSILTGARRRVVQLDHQAPGAVSPDMRRIAHVGRASGDGERHEIFWIDLSDGSSHRVPTREDVHYNGELQFTPDGVWITFRWVRDHESGLRAVNVETGEIRDLLRLERPSRLRPHWWLGPGRAIYVQHEAPPSGEIAESLHELTVDPETLRVSGDQVVSEWAGTDTWALSATPDGSRVLVVRAVNQSDVVIGSLATGEGELSPERFTLADADDRMAAWTPDGRALVFVSTRGGSEDLYRQARDAMSAEPLVLGPEADRAPAVRTDDSVLFLRWRQDEEELGQGPCRIMSLAAGEVREVIDLTPTLAAAATGCQIVRVRCASRADACFASHAEGTELVISRIDVERGSLDVALRLDRSGAPVGWVGWDVSADGASIVLPDPSGLVVHELATSRARSIAASGDGFNVMQTEFDGRGFVLVTSTEDEWFPTMRLLRVSPEGSVSTLLETERRFGETSVSPDGDAVALTEFETDADAWLLARARSPE